VKLVVKEVSEAYGLSEFSYLLKRLAQFNLVDFPLARDYARHVATLGEDRIPLVDSKDFPQLSAARSAHVDRAIECGKEQVATDYPLLPGETVQDEFFSYLAAPYRDEPAGTAVLHQITNFADVYFFFDDTRIEGDVIKFVAPAPVRVAAAAEALSLGGGIGAIALDLAKGLLGTLGSEIGSAILGAVLKEMGFDYSAPTAEVIKNIVHKEVTDTVVHQINGVIAGTNDWIKNSYGPLKARWVKEHSPDDLATMKTGLQDCVHDMYLQVIGPLRQDQFRTPGFPVFLIGVGVFLVLNQELALIDAPASPETSIYADTIRSSAKQYSDLGKTSYETIKTDRTNMISMYYDKTCSAVTGYPVCNYYWTWWDTYNSANQHFYPDKNVSMDQAKANCAADMEQHKQAALQQLDADLGRAGSVLQLWERLVNQPIPIPVG